MKTNRMNLLNLLAGILLILCPVTLSAQYGQGRGYQKGREYRLQQQGQIESQKIAFLTKMLDLTPDEAQQFWPVYNANRDLMKEEFISFRENHDFTPEDIDAMTDDEAKTFLNEQIDHEQKILNYKKEFNKKLEGILSPQKIVKLIEAEKDFKVELMRRATCRNNPPPQE
ncbi:MAG: hypothetical protein R2750_05130 [Bacteroidales bacterium]